MALHPLVYLMIFLFGLVFGSFFNVLIYRLPQEDPKERDWVKRPSHCPHCKHAIKPYDNIPLLSFLILRGCCRHCHAPISWRYPAVELGTGLLWVLTAWLTATYGMSGMTGSQMAPYHFVFAIFFASIYLLTFIIDFTTKLLPLELSIANLAGAWLFLLVAHGHTISPGWMSSLIGMFVLSGFFLLFVLFGAMGDGDLYFATGLGVLFGWQLVIAVGFLGICLGGLVGLLVIAALLLKRRYKPGIEIYFGPFLALAAYLGMFGVRHMVDWYLQLVHLQGIIRIH
jgi:leader peptidase (prepilin peptidase) / N-methyltransferase